MALVFFGFLAHVSSLGITVRFYCFYVVFEPQVIGEAAATGYVTKASLKASLGWPDDRLSRVMTGLLREGMAWIDDQCDGERQYWFPSVMGGLEEDEDGDDEDDDTVGAGGGAGAGAGASAV